jgi:HAD superfamily, subfamily IIIB (Acid phosphatase)
MRKTEAIIFDIDGTIANIMHRVHHVKGEKKNFDKFYDDIESDLLNEWAKAIISPLKEDYTIILCTGRMEQYRKRTNDWLTKHGIWYDFMLMRKDGDHRQDSIIKEELYKEGIEPHYKVAFVVDDRQQVVDMWRKLGLTCLQCAHGKY